MNFYHKKFGFKKLTSHLYNKRICDMIKLHDKKGRVFMEHLTFKQVSSLEKVFLTGNENMMEIKSASVLRGERYSYQVAFLPQLVTYLKNKGIADKTYFHVSDEPEPKHMENYKKGKRADKPPS